MAAVLVQFLLCIVGSRALLTTLLVNTTADTVDPTDDLLSLREALLVSNGTLSVSSLSVAEQALVSGSPSAPAPNQIGVASRRASRSNRAIFRHCRAMYQRFSGFASASR